MAGANCCRLQAESIYGLRFHEYHGANICLLDDRRRALRRVSFEKSVVFSERALRPFEPFLISIERTEGGWSGHLRLGISRLNPNERPLLEHSDDERRIFLSDSWMVAISHSPVAPSTSLPTDVGSLIGVYFEPISCSFARLHVVLNDSDLSPQMELIPLDGPLYAVVDVYGVTKQVRVVPMVRTVERLAALCERRIRSLISKRPTSVEVLPLPSTVKSLLLSSEAEAKSLIKSTHCSVLVPQPCIRSYSQSTSDPRNPG